MKRKVKTVRIAALFMALVLVLSNEHVLYALAAAGDNQTGGEITQTEGLPSGEGAITSPGGDNPASSQTGAATAKPGAESSKAPSPGETPFSSEKPTPSETPSSSENPVPGEIPSSSESPAPGATPSFGASPLPDEIPSPGESPSPGQSPDSDAAPLASGTPSASVSPEPSASPTVTPECIHEWIRDTETLALVCSICGQCRSEEETDCPEGGFHIYEIKEDNTGYVCVLCGTEKEALDGLDVTLEMYRKVTGNQIETLANDDPDSIDSSDLPKTLDELKDYVASKGSHNLLVDSLGDLLAVQALCKETDLEGYTVQIARRTVAGSSTGDTTWDLKGTDFEGLGSEAFPFKGTLYSAYTNGSLLYQLDTPFFQYLSTDANISEMIMEGAIADTSQEPVGVLAGVLVKGDKENVTLSNVEIFGTVSSTNGAAGMVFGRVSGGEDAPIKLSFNDADNPNQLKIGQNAGNESRSGSVSGLHAGGIAGEIEGNVEFAITDKTLNGNVTVKSITRWSHTDNESGQLEWDKTSAAGMYAGAIQDGKITIAGSNTPYQVNVQKADGSGGANGGFAGMALRTVVETSADADNQITVSGTGVDGRIAGGVLGYYDHSGNQTERTLKLDYITVQTPVSAAGGPDYFAGGVIGRYYRGVSDKNNAYDTIEHVTVSGAVSAAYFAGGIAGFVHGGYLKIGGADSESIKITGNVTNQTTGWGGENDACGAGGVVGWISGQYVEIQNVKVTADFHQNCYAAGGIVGAVGQIKPAFTESQSSIIKISNISVASSYGTGESRWRGGLLGMVFPGSMIALDGDINVDMTSSQGFGRVGHIAGYQKEALVYLEQDASYARPAGKNWVDDIGNYGGVYRNGEWGEAGESLISYENGRVNGTVEKSGGTWVLDSEADSIRLAIMLNTEEKYAADCFSGAGKAELLSADYSVTKSLNLQDSGIYCLNRNDSLSESFTGTFKGSGSGNVTINLGDLKTRQSYLALFPCTGDGAEVSGFTLKRTIDGASKYAAGIACLASGGFTAEDIVIDLTSDDAGVTAGIRGYYAGKDLETKNLDDLEHYYGGLAAKVNGTEGASFVVKNVKVDGSFQTDVNNEKLVLGGMAAVYEQSGTATSFISVDGFELGNHFQINSKGRKNSGMITLLNAEAADNRDATLLSMSNIKIHDGASISQEYSGDEDCGGWLGLAWKNVAPGASHYSLENVVIGDGNGAQAGPQFSANGPFGGLVGTVTGRIRLQDISIENAVFYNNGSKDGIGLLFRDGINALIEIDGYAIGGRQIGDYEPDNSRSVQVTGCDGVNFDEIVAYNIGTGREEDNKYHTGGIVNIIYNGIYQNRLLSSNNARTRYYYNLFGKSFAGEESYLADGEKLAADLAVITNEKQMMIWHLTQYMNDSIRRYLNTYYEGGTVAARGQNTVFQDTIDLQTVSYYPTPVEGGSYTSENAVIKFYGADITNKATEKMTPASDKKQHYMMHAGLFMSRTGDVTVGDASVSGEAPSKFLTLEGSITNLGENSGVLFTGDIGGKKNIYRIKLKNLYVTDYASDGEPHSIGLMIGKVNDKTELDISWIETEYQQPVKKAAAALIGTVGNEKAKEISIEFTNLRLDSRKNDGVFAWASLIDKNYYLDDRTNVEEDKLRRIRYLFTENALRSTTANNEYSPFVAGSVYGDNTYTESYVTIGEELSEGVIFWDSDDGKGPEDGTSYTLPFTGSFAWSADAVKVGYLPYVHVNAHKGSKEIEVNPKNLSIENGCGTYEDPYQITDARQLLALARYLQNKNDYKYLAGWQIHDFESGRASNSLCAQNHLGTDLKTYGPTGPGDDFPTQEELSQAYYMIVEDIDFSKMKNATDKQIAEDFCGLGTENMPFRGVIIGQKKADGTCPAITLPLRKKWSDATMNTNHGLIQYAKGVVVKDLNIEGAGDADDRTGVAKVEEAAGGAIARVLGGDNIIDNVSVTLDVALTSTEVCAGAYVGNVEQGSVILRNLSESCARGFRAGWWDADAGVFTPISSDSEREDYLYVSGLIGKVEDGCVIYDDTFSVGAEYGEAVLPHDAKEISGKYQNAVLSVCRHYNILVKSQLDKAIEQGGIKVTGGGGSFTASVANAAQLQIVSMAINSDAFSIYYGAGGYDAKAMCRKAEYSHIGEDSSTDITSGSDFSKATTEDDKIYYKPYLYNYFDFSDLNNGSEDTLLKQGNVYISRLNAATTDITDVMNYELSADTTYDMSVYGRGFRGLGATYGMLETQVDGNLSSDVLINGSFYSDFRANFNGNGATIQLAIDRTYDSNVHTAALFNDLLDRTSQKTYTIQNLVITGSIVSVKKELDNQGDDQTDGNGTYPNRTAAVAGFMRKPWALKDITVKDMAIEAKGHTAGMVAWIWPESNQTYTFEECRVETTGAASAGTDISSYGGSVGGIVGVMTQNADEGAFTGVSLNLKGCTIAGTAGHPVVIEVKNRTGEVPGMTGDTQMAAGRSGGLIGYIGRRTDDCSEPSVALTIEKKDSVEVWAAYADITGAYSTGGLIGGYDALEDNTRSTVRITGTKVEQCRIKGTRGNIGTEDEHFNYGVGGMMGEMRGYSLTVDGTASAVAVSNTDIQSTMQTGNGMYAGGIVGCLKAYKQADFTDVEVKGELDGSTTIELGGQQYVISSEKADAGGVIGKSVGREVANKADNLLTMSGVRVYGMNITVNDWKTENGEKVFATDTGSAGNAGGVLGANQMHLTISGAAQTEGSGALVEKCMITASAGNAGGILGTVNKKYSQQYNTGLIVTDIQNIKVTESVIGYNHILGSQTNSGAGGVYGGITDTSKIENRHRLESALIDECWIYGVNAGGILGKGDAHGVLFSEAARNDSMNPAKNVTDVKDWASITVKNNSIYGSQAGGAIGNSNMKYVFCIGMYIADNRLQSYGTTTANVGGFCGQESSNSNYILDYIAIRKNHVLAASTALAKQINAGGFFGYSGNSKNYIYRAELIDNLIGYSECENGAALLKGQNAEGKQAGIATLHSLFNTTDGKIGNTDRAVYLIEGTNVNSLKTVAMPATVEEIHENKIGYYAARIGNFIGSSDLKKHTYFIAPVVSYSDAVSTRPVIDVGANVGAAIGTEEVASLFGSPYGYRKEIHIVYHDEENPADEDAEVWNAWQWEGMPSGWNFTLFDGVSYRKQIEAYRKANNGTSDSVGEYLDAYRLNMIVEQETGTDNLNVEEVYQKLYRNDSGLVSRTLELGSPDNLPVIVLDTQYGTTDQLIKGILAALTGAGGVYSSDESNVYTAGMAEIISNHDGITGITAEPMEIGSDNKIKKIVNGKASLKASKNGNQWVIDYQDYDNDGTNGQPQTFTLLTITYSTGYNPLGGAGRVVRKEVIRIPVFVQERLEVSVHTKIIEDFVYNVDKVKQDGLCSAVTIANDSQYTLYAEYIYGSSRDKYSGTKIEKQVGMTNQNGQAGFAPGTRLTLIDVDAGNKVYYYTVPEGDTGPYPYTRFTDADGKAYANKDISESTDESNNAGFQIYGENETFTATGMVDGREETISYSDVAVERFLITVDISGVKKDERIETEARQFDVSPVIPDELKRRTTLNDAYTKFDATIQEGMEISFYNKDGSGEEEKTWINGNIKADEEGIVNIWAAIDIKADQLYWSAVTQNGGQGTIDSANTNKYLELQLSMTDSDNNQVVFPDGTNVTISGKRTQPENVTVPGMPEEIEEKKLDPCYDKSNIYFYKDSGELFKLDDLLKIYNADDSAKTAEEWGIRWVDQMTLDFRKADMASFDKEEYTMDLKLLRVEDPEYPAAAEIIDTYNKAVPAAQKQDLACAVETKDLMQLGINTYESKTQMPHEIEFDFKLDFSGILTGNDATDKDNTDKQYTVAYCIWEKIEDGGTTKYVRCSDKNMGQLELELVNPKTGETLNSTQSTNVSTDGVKFWYVDYTFDWDEIKNGTEYEVAENGTTTSKQDEGVIIRSLKLKVSDASQMDLSNYKVQAIVYIKDSDNWNPIHEGLNLDTITTLTDFFVYTVAKLKTDLDY